MGQTPRAWQRTWDLELRLGWSGEFDVRVRSAGREEGVSMTMAQLGP